LQCCLLRAEASRFPDPQLHELLTLVDAIRGGRAGERALAARELSIRLIEDPG